MDVRGQAAGFTLIELIIVIVLIGILLTVGVAMQTNLQDYASNQERADDTASIARQLEAAYTDQDLGTPSYPSTTELANDMPTRTRTMSGINPDSLTAPGATGISVVAANSVSTTQPSDKLSISTYVYQPLTRAGTLCTANPSSTPVSNNCVRFFLYYETSPNRTLQSIASLHQQ